MCKVNWKNKQAEYKYFVSPPDSFFVWSSDLTDLPLKMKEEMQNCTFSTKLSSGCTWLPFPNHIRRGLRVFLEPLFALTPGRQSGAAWHGEPGLWPLVPGPWRSSSSSRTLFPPQRLSCSREHPLIFMLRVSGYESACQVFCYLDFSRWWILEINALGGALDASTKPRVK